MSCNCKFTPGMSHEELVRHMLRDNSFNCCDPYSICRNLDRELRRADKEAQRKNFLERRKKTTPE